MEINQEIETALRQLKSNWLYCRWLMKDGLGMNELNINELVAF